MMAGLAILKRTYDLSDEALCDLRWVENPYFQYLRRGIFPNIGNILDRCITDAGYCGHNAPPDHKFKVYSRRRSSASSNGVPPLSPSSSISSNITTGGAITSPTPAATPSTLCSPPPAIFPPPPRAVEFFCCSEF